MIANKLNDKLKEIKLVATDFDGVHTDGFVYQDQFGKEMVRCSRRDGLGIEMLKRAGIKVCVISKETNSVVEARCKKLDIEFYQKISDGEGKLQILKRIVEENNLTPQNVLYVGDDINDVDCLNYAGVAITVLDHHYVLDMCDYVTTRKGGDHAIREICELVLLAQAQKIEF